MFSIIFAILWAFLSPTDSGNSPHGNNGDQVSTFDTGGETGHIPPKPPKPQP